MDVPSPPLHEVYDAPCAASVAHSIRRMYSFADVDLMVRACTRVVQKSFVSLQISSLPLHLTSTRGPIARLVLASIRIRLPTGLARRYSALSPPLRLFTCEGFAVTESFNVPMLPLHVA